MLNSVNLNDKNYDNMINEAILRIPLYTSEWTNFNPSDPGLTLLQNLTAFNYLQSTKINEVSEAVRLRLLALLGFFPRENRTGRVWLELQSEREQKLPSELKLTSGELCFETERLVTVRPSAIRAVFSEDCGEYTELTPLLSRDVKAGAYIFGKAPKEDRSLLCVLDRLPESQEPYVLYAGVAGEEKRNPLEDGCDLSLAKISWQVFSENGFIDVEFEDETRAFLMSGAIKLSLGGVTPAVFTGAPVSGYALRCILTDESYDLPPKLSFLAANLFEAVQKNTRSRSFSFESGEPIRLFSELAGCGNCFVYAHEAGDESDVFREYKRFSGRGRTDENGRYYTLTERADGEIEIVLESAKAHDAAKVVLYSDDIINHIKLGPVYGYDNQIVEIGHEKNLVPEDFQIIARSRDENGDAVFRFVKPGETDPDKLCYKVISENGSLLITEPGLSEDCELFICDCAVTAGAEGNIREGCRLNPSPYGTAYRELVITNPAPGKGGQSHETPEQLRLRFAREMKTATSAVTAADYEELALKTPGLCIHKVKAFLSENDGLVKVVVKPHSGDKNPVLSPQYIRQISNWLGRHRLITTELRIVQPVVVPVDVSAVIYAKSYFENAREEIESRIKLLLDHVGGDTPFGAVLSYTNIYQAVSELDCVDSIYRLSLHPRGKADVKSREPDIVLGEDCLAAPGRITLEIIPASQLS